MSFIYDLIDETDFFNLSFATESGEIIWFQNDIKKNSEFLNEGLKSILPKKQIFKMKSLIYNVENQTNDVNAIFNCSYNDEENTLSIIIDENINHSKLTKEVAMSLFHFVQKTDIKKLYLIVALKNPNYILILQNMMTLGFQSEKSVKSTNINGETYKILEIETKDMSINIEEFGI